MLEYINGDATYPELQIKWRKNIIIAHICNDIGRWGSGFVLAVSKRWKKPEKEYYSICEYNLGDVQYVNVEENITVANMIAQRSVRDYTTKNYPPPIRYEMLRQCLVDVNNKAMYSEAEIHMPKIGAGLAGGDWNIIETIINETITVPVYVYEWDK